MLVTAPDAGHPGIRKSFSCAKQTCLQPGMDPNTFTMPGVMVPGVGQQQQAGGGGMGGMAAFLPMMQQMSSFFDTQMRERAAAQQQQQIAAAIFGLRPK